MRGTTNKTGIAYKRDAVGALIGVLSDTTGTAGSPGTWGPGLKGELPANCKAVQTANPTASPASAWTSGQYLETGDGEGVHWDGSAWQCGSASAQQQGGGSTAPCDNLPAQSASKTKLLEWLESVGIDIEDASSLTKPELWTLITDYCD